MKLEAVRFGDVTMPSKPSEPLNAIAPGRPVAAA
jgi:hypothetical protein